MSYFYYHLSHFKVLLLLHGKISNMHFGLCLKIKTLKNVHQIVFHDTSSSEHLEIPS